MAPRDPTITEKQNQRPLTPEEQELLLVEKKERKTRASEQRIKVMEYHAKHLSSEELVYVM